MMVEPIRSFAREVRRPSPLSMGAALLLPVIAAAACASSPRQSPETAPPTATTTASRQASAGAGVAALDSIFVVPDLGRFTRTPTGLQYFDEEIGTGAVATDLREVEVHYVGMLENRTIFDSSLRRDSTFTFTLGMAAVIPGWDQGVRGMRVGGRRILVIPHTLAYGPDGRPPVIPPRATLIFNVRLVSIR
jgi:FKBP-type peptidyl-prolyl cis-trans isomerase FkpA